MSQAVPGKIVLKSTTKISLNQRFGEIQKVSRASTTTQHVQHAQLAQQQATSKNRRLAQQMANRPGVQAALRLKKRSLQQRLGQANVKARLSLGQVRGRGGMVAGGQRARGRGTMRGRGRGAFQSPGRGGGYTYYYTPRGGTRGVRGTRGTPTFRTRGGRGFVRGRGTFRGRGGGYVSRGQGSRRGRGAMRGRGRGRGGVKVEAGMSREDLDNQLDEYMSNAKSSLDAQLDAYMQHDDD